MRFLQRRAKVETRYGGRFVEEINGVRSGRPNGGARRDWFYFVNGIEADVGAAEHEVHAATGSGGTTVTGPPRCASPPWSDRSRSRSSTVRMARAFRSGSTALGARTRPCNALADRLSGPGSSRTPRSGAAGGEELRFVVGRWGDVRNDAAARQIEQGPGESGVFARLVARGRRLGSSCSTAGERSRTLTRGGGLVAATRFEEQQPTWVVSGTDEAGLESAARCWSSGPCATAMRLQRTAALSIGLPVQGAAPMTLRARPTARPVPRSTRPAPAWRRLHPGALRGRAPHTTIHSFWPRRWPRHRCRACRGCRSGAGSAARLALPLALLVASSTRWSRRRG